MGIETIRGNPGLGLGEGLTIKWQKEFTRNDGNYSYFDYGGSYTSPFVKHTTIVH